MVKMKIADIVQDEALWPREGLSEHQVDMLVAALRAGSSLPAVIIDAASNRLVDGFHRLAAYERMEIETVQATKRSYESEDALFADAMRLNMEHGQNLEAYEVRLGIHRLLNAGWKPEQIGEAIRRDPVQIEGLMKTSALAGNETVPLKGGLKHLRGKQLTEGQQKAMKRHSGMSATFYAEQLLNALDNGFCPDTERFREAMDQIVERWAAQKAEQKEAA